MVTRKKKFKKITCQNVQNPNPWWRERGGAGEVYLVIQISYFLIFIPVFPQSPKKWEGSRATP